MTNFNDPVTLNQRLSQSTDPVAQEALERIKFLERLCGMMTDTGVILEEDAAELSKADVWGGCDDDGFYEALDAAVESTDSGELEIVELQRWHQLPNSWAVILPALSDGRGREISPRKAEEFASYTEAEEAVAGFNLMRRRVEHGA